jgi:pyridoxamine 5'-phosphate oxidase
VFFTDHRSQKGQELAADPRAAVVLFWQPLERQVRVTGRVARLADAASLAYFRSRPRGAQLGAWASQQSAPIANRDVLERGVAAVQARFGDGDLPLPPHWGGYALQPATIEFWQGRPDRLHDRFLFTRTSESGWQRVRLSP